VLGLLVPTISEVNREDLVAPWFIVNPGTSTSSPDVFGVPGRIITSLICFNFTLFLVPASPFMAFAGVDQGPAANEGPKAVEGVTSESVKGVTGESVGRAGGGMSSFSSFCFFLLAMKSFSESFTLAGGGGGGVEEDPGFPRGESISPEHRDVLH
jgi:hypothetical protein